MKARPFSTGDPITVKESLDCVRAQARFDSLHALVKVLGAGGYSAKLRLSENESVRRKAEVE